MAERSITFGNVFNFRDLGGYRGDGGRTVRWGRLFRADDLCRLDDADLSRLGDLGIRTVVDLRRPREVERMGRVAEGTYAWVNAHVVHTEWQWTEFPDPQSRVDWLAERYADMVERGGPAIGEALRLVADPDAAPLVFHCISGKDRTGLVAAFTLHLLGVSDDDVADDYALSEPAEEANLNWYAARDPEHTLRRLDGVAVVPREAMLAVFDNLRARHGSVRDYLRSVGVTDGHVESMREHLLA
ncbi:tyrosine-protein phosphatase [Virgisporangium ochraceum]|uniref:Protein-tyrosine-phosphatase n=1 Tax=Virgisporangium ochraceum TaxID=65505 RepID=A0A8J3ZXQ1_9ACTN|nr:tyrosine-protein phosphatase [Virgisporangium ochraceum]GIJ71999.1 protein-tyrosine-phosphatase [Virgisporangium ochraceum]